MPRDAVIAVSVHLILDGTERIKCSDEHQRISFNMGGHLGTSATISFHNRAAVDMLRDAIDTFYREDACTPSERS